MLLNRVCGLLPSENLKEVSFSFYFILNRARNNCYLCGSSWSHRRQCLDCLYNLKNLAEVQRLQEEHLGEYTWFKGAEPKGSSA